jgi:hypothetical protein
VHAAGDEVVRRSGANLADHDGVAIGESLYHFIKCARIMGAVSKRLKKSERDSLFLLSKMRAPRELLKRW